MYALCIFMINVLILKNLFYAEQWLNNFSATINCDFYELFLNADGM